MCYTICEEKIMETGDNRYNARLSRKVYDNYFLSLEKAKKSFRKHVKTQKTFFNMFKCLDIPVSKITCYKDYEDIIFNVCDCHQLQPGEKVPEGILRMSDGGTFPCSFVTVLSYFGISTSVLEVGEKFVRYGYRTPSKGCLWLCMDVLMPMYYGLKTNLIYSPDDIFESIKNNNPVLLLADSKWVHGDLRPEGDGTEVMTIWGSLGNSFLVTDTSHNSPRILDIKDVLSKTIQAWSVSK